AGAVGGFEALRLVDVFEVEYCELEQAKLGLGRGSGPLTGEVAVVTGAACGIGRACAEALLAKGASVVGIDLAPSAVDSPEYLGVQADVTDPGAMAAALEAGVHRFGGVDIVVPSAGVFLGTQRIAELDRDKWRRTMAVNADAIADLFARVHPLLALSPRGGRV